MVRMCVTFFFNVDVIKMVIAHIVEETPCPLGAKKANFAFFFLTDDVYQKTFDKLLNILLA